MSRQPFKSVEAYADDAGFEYMPSEQSSHIDDQPQEVMHLSTPSAQQQLVSSQDRLSPSKLRNSKESLAYSACKSTVT